MQIPREKKRLILHIGIEKTGTTSLQNYLSSNRPRLLDRGFLYPESCGAENHIKLALYASEEPNIDLFRVEYPLETENSPHLRQMTATNLTEEVKKFPFHDVILSNEHCSSRLGTAQEIHKLRELIYSLDRTVTVVVYLRRQVDVLTSLYSTIIKGGEIIEFDELLANQPFWLDFSSLLELWSNAFGTSNVRAVLFDEKRSKTAGLEREFASLVGVSDVDGLEICARRNKSLDYASIEFLKIFNKDVPKYINNKKNPYYDDVVEILETVSRGKKMALDPTINAYIEQKYARSNRDVAERMFALDRASLFDPYEHSAWIKDRTRLTFELATKIACELWKKKQRDILTLRGEFLEH